MARRVQPHSAAAVARAVLLLWVALQSSAVQGECNSQYCCNREGAINTCILQSHTDMSRIAADTEQELNIIGGREVLLNLELSGKAAQSLRRLHFSDMQTLDVKANTKAYFGPNRDISLAVRNVSELRLRTSAFHGWQSALATLTVSDTDRVYIENDAFPPNSTFRRVQFTNVSYLKLESGAIRGTVAFLQLKNIKSLDLYNGAIEGNIETLSVEDAAVKICYPKAIGGSAGAVSLRSVTVWSAQFYCLYAASGWHRLTIEDCTFDNLLSGSVRGSISSVSISDSWIGIAGLGAISVNTTEFSVSNVTISQLGTWAFSVRAATSAHVSRLRVDHLSRDALFGLRFDSSSAGAGVLAVSGLSVGYAAPGALRFTPGTAVTLTDLELRGGCVCGSPSWARHLLLGTSSTGQQHVSGISDSDGRGLTEQQAALLRQIDAGVCTVEGVSLAEFTSDRCGAVAGTVSLSGDTSGTGGTCTTSGWWFYVGIASLTGLLLTLAVLLAITASRCRRRRRMLESRLDAQWQGDAKSKTVPPDSRSGRSIGNQYSQEPTSVGSAVLRVAWKFRESQRRSKSHLEAQMQGAAKSKTTPPDSQQPTSGDPAVQADPQRIYAEIGDPASTGDQSAGGGAQKSPYANVAVPAGCPCAATAVPAGMEGCSCNTGLNTAKSRYANMPPVADTQVSEARTRQKVPPTPAPKPQLRDVQPERID